MDSDSNDSSQWYSRCNNIFSGLVCFPVSGVIGLAAEECTPSGRSGAVFPQLLQYMDKHIRNHIYFLKGKRNKGLERAMQGWFCENEAIRYEDEAIRNKREPGEFKWSKNLVTLCSKSVCTTYDLE